MNYQTLGSALLGAVLTFSGILLTQVFDIRKQKRAHEELIHAPLLQGIQDELLELLELSKTGAVHPIDSIPDGKIYEGLFTATQDYFAVYHANAALIMQIDDPNLRRKIIQTYTRLKGLLDIDPSGGPVAQKSISY
jgi:hypothetical protein